MSDFYNNNNDDFLAPFNPSIAAMFILRSSKFAAPILYCAQTTIRAVQTVNTAREIPGMNGRKKVHSLLAHLQRRNNSVIGALLQGCCEIGGCGGEAGNKKLFVIATMRGHISDVCLQLNTIERPCNTSFN